MNEVRTATPFRDRSLATNVTRRMFSSRSFFEKPRSRVRSWRTTSPSSRSTRCPFSARIAATRSPTADFPEHGSPVNHSVKPSFSWHMRDLSFLLGTEDPALHVLRRFDGHQVEDGRGDVEDVAVEPPLQASPLGIAEDVDPVL